MLSKEIYRMTTTVLCITILLILVHCASSQPLSVTPWNNDEIDDTVANSFWIKPSSDSEYNDMNIENGGSNELSQTISKLLFAHDAHDDINQPNSSGPVRRANFWKRANFWRKRANFWRRDLAP